MARTREKMKGRRNRGGSFSALVHEYFQSEQYARLSPRAVKLLIDLYCQYRGSNNGDLCAAWRFMQPAGWRSKDQLGKALRELELTGWIVQTRKGGIHWPALYALTFLGIDACGGKLDSGIRVDTKPMHLWRLPGLPIPPRSQRRVTRKNPTARNAGHCDPAHGTQITPIRGFVSRSAGQS